MGYRTHEHPGHWEYKGHNLYYNLSRKYYFGVACDMFVLVMLPNLLVNFSSVAYVLLIRKRVQQIPCSAQILGFWTLYVH